MKMAGWLLGCSVGGLYEMPDEGGGTEKKVGKTKISKMGGRGGGCRLGKVVGVLKRGRGLLWKLLALLSIYFLFSVEKTAMKSLF